MTLIWRIYTDKTIIGIQKHTDDTDLTDLHR